MGCLSSAPLQKTIPQQRFQMQLGSFSDEKTDNDPRLIPSSRTPENIAAIVQGCQYDQPLQIFEWVMVKEIGKGSRSHVFLAKNVETNEICAAKFYDKSLLMRQTLENLEAPYVAVQREIEIMAAVDHRYILQAKEVIEDDVSDAIIIFMPYSDRGTLQNMIDAGQFTENLIPICFYEIAESLRYLHSLNIVHRDIKPENILVFSDTSYVLSDFSVSTALSDENELLDDTMGSPAFLSPEECGQDSFAPKPADMWSYGVSLYYAFFHMFPFNLDSCHGQTAANTAVAVTHLLTTEELKFPEGTDMDSDVVRLISSILVKDPTKRPTFEEIVNDKYFDCARDIDKENFAKWEEQKKEEEEKEKQKEKEQQNDEEVPDVPSDEYSSPDGSNKSNEKPN